MKKGILTLLSLVLMASSAFGSDVLFKMEMVNTGSVKTAANSTSDIADQAIVFGGTIEAVNTGESEQTMIINESSIGYVRISSSNTHLHLTLSQPLQVGDIIRIEDKGGEIKDSVLITRANTRVRYNNDRNVVRAGTDFIVPQASNELAGASELWIWYERKIPVYIKSLTITRTNVNPLAVEYLFNEEEIGAIGTASSTTTLNNGLVVKNDASTNNAIANLAGSKVLYLAGGGSDRVATFNVTDPCTIEIWGRSSNENPRTVYLAEGSYKSTSASTAVTGLSSVARSQLYKGTYNYTGVEDNKTIYVQVDGGFHIAAIRVIYDRIRPVANFSVTPASAVLHVGDPAQVFTYNKDYEGAIINRGKTEGSDNNWVHRGAEVDNTSVAFSALEAGIDHIYTLKLTQEADAYCRAAVVEVPIHILGAGESSSDVSWNRDYVSSSSYVWKNDENATLIENSKTTTFDNNHDAIGEFAAGTGLRLAAGRTFTLSVPSNKRIERLNFSGYSVSETGNLTPEGGSAQSFADGTNPITKVTYSDIDAQSFTFAVSGRNLIVKIDLVTTDLGYYPVTFGSNWASFCAPEDVVLPEGVFAYIAESKGKNSENEDVVVVNKVESSTIPAGGYLLYSETAGDYNLNAATGASALEGTNLLMGTTARTAKPAEGTTYVLNSNGELAPYTGNYIPANKAYLHIPADDPSGAPARIRLVVGGEQTATGLESEELRVKSEKRIENGQLVIIKNGVRYNAVGQVIR